MALKKHGITAETPKSMILAAGTVYKNLKFVENEWQGEVLGATSGGSKFSYVKEFLDAEVDGAKVKVKGLKFKISEECTLEVNMTEFTQGILKTALLLTEAETQDVAGYKKLISKADVEDGDYLENIAYVGWLTSGKPVIIIMPNALCTSGLEMEPKDKEQATYTLTFEPHADIEGDLDVLPVEVYYPEAA